MKILTPEEEAKLMKMYRKQVLEEPPATKLLQIGGLAAGLNYSPFEADLPW